MVTYTEWTAIVHDEYKAMGGGYQAQGVVQAVTRAAADFWNRRKDEIIELAADAAATLARELINEYIQREGAFP